MNDRENWDQKAEAWHRHVGEDGDDNRRFNSDPVLWRMLGDVNGLDILDAGCGTGYLARQLTDRGARVTGIDASPEMVRIAREKTGLDSLHVDNAETLSTLDDDQFDRVVSNYVLMDLSDAEAAISHFARVLRPSGEAVIVFLHPCFDAPGGPERLPDETSQEAVRYTWPKPYIETWDFHDRWGPFDSDFHTYHRPLSYYFRSFLNAGFQLLEFEEPVIPISHPTATDHQITRYRWAVFSCAFHVALRPA